MFDRIISSFEDVSAALGKACEHDADGDPVYLAAMIIRPDMSRRKVEFDSSFHTQRQE